MEAKQTGWGLRYDAGTAQDVHDIATETRIERFVHTRKKGVGDANGVLYKRRVPLRIAGDASGPRLWIPLARDQERNAESIATEYSRGGGYPGRAL